MLPSPHVCSRCKSQVVHTDCLPVVCYICRMDEAMSKAISNEVEKKILGTPADTDADTPTVVKAD